jgi:hypothetical protein
MKWTHKLTSEEFEMFTNKLNYFFEPIYAKIILEDTPVELFESVRNGAQEEHWKAYIYNIDIIGANGTFKVIEGFEDGVDIKWQIEHKARITAFSYWCEKDFNRDSLLSERLFQK